MTKQEKSLTMTVLMTPDMANFSGNVHGGSLLKLLDQVFFKQQVNVGELVTFYARVNHVGRSSMEIGVKVVAEHLRTYEKRHTTSCYFTMVAIDENGKSVEVPRLELETDTEKKLFAAGEMRKKMRQDNLEKNRALQIDIEDEL